jgi:hypothetical protein
MHHDNLPPDVPPLANLLSFREISDIPFDTYMAAFESCHLNGHDGELHLGKSLLRGPIKRDQHLGTWQIEVSLSRGPLRRPVRMRLVIAPWSPSATALELIPCQQVRRSAAYYAAGHRLLDSLTRTLQARMPTQQRPDQDYLGTPVKVGGPPLNPH